MNDILKDIKFTKEVMKGCSSSFGIQDNGDFYNKIYMSSNEDILGILSNFDIKNKDVLTVIGSGDQPLFFYNLLANKVDIFDINKFAIYYFYIRVWTIKYLNQYYPDILFNKNFLDNLLNVVIPNNSYEEYVLNYWKRYNELFSFEDTIKLSCGYGYRKFENCFCNLSIINNGLEHRFPNIYNCDISSENNIEGLDDIIYTSNLSDYIYDVEGMNLYCRNLSKLLKKDGAVICSNVVYDGIGELELDVMKKVFDYYQLPQVLTSSKKEPCSLGYYYKFKR